MPRTPTWIIATPCIHQQSTLKVSGSGVCEPHPLYHPHSFHLAFSWTFFPGVAAMPASQFFQVSLKNASLLLHRAQRMRNPRVMTGKQEYRNFLLGFRYSATFSPAHGLPCLGRLTMVSSNVPFGDLRVTHLSAYGYVNFTHG